MFNRDILTKLIRWAGKKGRKPLVLRGARQVGKTTVVKMFSKGFDQYLYLNLEKKEEREIFEREYPFSDLLTTLFIYAQKKRIGGRTLIFIDEVQNSPRAIALLRYFYEEANDLFVIAAGSLLENILDRKVSFPVGRVEFLAIRPFSFHEFIAANNQGLAEALEQPEVPAFLHNQLTDWFKKYATIGGMPEVVKEYVESNQDITALGIVYDSLITSYIDDVEKYVTSSAQLPYVRHVIFNIFREGGTKVTFEKFGGAGYRSREMKDAFHTIEKAMLINLVYPSTSVEIPASPVLRRKPRLHVLDTGLINHSLKLMGEMVFNANISDTYRGIIAEHIVGQELLARDFSIASSLNFWVREKAESSAEVDYILPYHGKIIPIEVKSGPIGKMRSLFRFMDEAPHNIAIRVYQGEYLVQQAKTIEGKEFTLLNLPFYMVHRIGQELEKIM
jgi:uncharacterized protein